MHRSSRLNSAISIFYNLIFATALGFGLQPFETTPLPISGQLEIPTIRLASNVTPLKLDHHRLNTPSKIVGSFSSAPNKTLLIGHSSSVFKSLYHVPENTILTFKNRSYKITSKVLLEKSAIDMQQLLASTDRETLVLMTCAGQNLGAGDATHRLIFTAEIL